jgi:ribosomal protein L7/L12
MSSLGHGAPGTRLTVRGHEIHLWMSLSSLVRFAVLLAGDANGQPFEASKWKTYSVNAETNVREAGSVDSLKILVLPKGTKVRTATEYLDLQAGDIYSLAELDWAEVKLPDGRRGFIASHLLEKDDEADALVAIWLLYSAIAVPLIARWKNRGKWRWALSSFFLFIPGLVIPFMPKASEEGDKAPAPVVTESSEQVKSTAATPPEVPETTRPSAPTFRKHAFKCASCGAGNEVSVGDLDSGPVVCEYCDAPDLGAPPAQGSQRTTQQVKLFSPTNNRADIQNPDAATVDRELRLAFSEGDTVIMSRGDAFLQTADGVEVELGDGHGMPWIIEQGMQTQPEIIALFQDFAAGGNQYQQWERVGPDPAPAAPAEEQQTVFDAVLLSVGNKKIAVIKEVRAITGLGLKEAKDLVEAAPKALKEGVGREEADEIKAKIEILGGQVELVYSRLPANGTRSPFRA